MKSIFVDTAFLIALVNRRDQFHASAQALLNSESNQCVTTQWVLLEFANHLSDVGSRNFAVRMIGKIRRSKKFRVLPPSESQFEDGLSLYAQRFDKAWSLTDCISFLAMRELGIAEALTSDHHFEQAGFVALLK